VAAGAVPGAGMKWPIPARRAAAVRRSRGPDPGGARLAGAAAGARRFHLSYRGWRPGPSSTSAWWWL